MNVVWLLAIYILRISKISNCKEGSNVPNYSGCIYYETSLGQNLGYV